MKVLLTGAAGFIGSHLAERLCGRGDTVVGFDNFDDFYPRAIKERNLVALRGAGRFSLVQGDLRNPVDLARALGGVPVDVVVHLAALAGVRPSLKDPARFTEVNVLGTTNVLDACRARGIMRLIFASSSSVYGQGSAVPFRESDPCARPVSPYAATKRAGELLTYTAHHLHGINTTCLRFFTVYGPRQRPDLAIHKFTRAIATDQPIELFGDGETCRDYTFIDDIIDGVVASIDQQARDGTPQYRIFNLGGSQTTTLRRLVELISAAVGKSPVITWAPEQPGDMPRTLADLTLSGGELGYAPKVSIETGIPRFVSWWRGEYGAGAQGRP